MKKSIMLFIVTSLFLLIKAIHHQLEISVVLMIGYFAASWLIGFFVPIAPAGLGVREAVLIFFLNEALVPDPLPMVIAILFRVLLIFQDLFWALFAKIMN